MISPNPDAVIDRGTDCELAAGANHVLGTLRASLGLSCVRISYSLVITVFRADRLLKKDIRRSHLGHDG